jgi:hypothetical protein
MNEMHGNERALKNKNRHIADNGRGDQWECEHGVFCKLQSFGATISDIK